MEMVSVSILRNGGTESLFNIESREESILQ